jgi:hypothetical protein
MPFYGVRSGEQYVDLGTPGFSERGTMKDAGGHNGGVGAGVRGELVRRGMYTSRIGAAPSAVSAGRLT